MAEIKRQLIGIVEVLCYFQKFYASFGWCHWASLHNQKSNSSKMLEIFQLVFSYVLIHFSFQATFRALLLGPFWGVLLVVGHAIPCGGGCGCYWRFGRCGARNCCFSVLEVIEVLRSWCALKG